MATETPNELQFAITSTNTTEDTKQEPITNDQLEDKSQDHILKDIHNVHALYFIYNGNKLSGPHTKDQIISLYIERKIKTSKIWIKGASKESTEWYTMVLPENLDKKQNDQAPDAINAIKTKCAEKNSEIQKQFPTLYKFIENVYLGKIERVELPKEVPTKAEQTSKYKTFSKRLGQTLYIIAAFIIGFHVFPSLILACCCVVGPMMIVLCIKDLDAQNEDTCFARMVWPFYAVFYVGIAVIPVVIILLILYETELYPEIQSWMISYITWGIVSYIFTMGYMTAAVMQQELTLINNIILLINGVDFDVDVSQLVKIGFEKNEGAEIDADAWAGLGIVFIFPSIASVLPSSIVGFIANYVLEEKFELKCNDEIINDTLCFDEKFGCCEVISSHDVRNTYAFIGGLASNILATWAFIRIVGYLMVNINPEVSMLAKRNK
eukprot:297066_1